MYQQQQQHFLPTTTTFVPIQNLPPPSQRPRPQQQHPNPKQPATPRVAAAKRSKKKGSSSLCSVNSQGMAIAKISKNNPSARPKKLFGGKSKAQVLKRNARERNRVQNMNGQYVELACQLSNWEELKDQKLTKSETLKAAILYIQHLEELIQDDNINSTIKPNRSTPTRMIKSEEEQQPFSPPLSSSVTFADLLLFETVPKQHEGNIIINQQQQDVLLPQQSQYLLQKNLPQSQYHHHCHSHSHNSSRSATPSSYMLYANGNPTTIESSHSHNQLSPQFVLMSQTSSYPPNSLCCQQQNFSRYHNQTAVMPLTIRNETNSQQHIPHNYHQHHYGEAFETPNATDFKPHRSF